MIDEQTFREALGAIFFALLADRDYVSARASADVLRGAIETGAVQDPAARGILRSIVKSARTAELLSRTFSTQITPKQPPSVMALARSSTIDEPVAIERPSNRAAHYQDVFDRWLLDVAENLGPRPGARAAHQKLKKYAGTDYPRDRDSGTVPAGERGTLFLMLESRDGDLPPEDRILERLQECHLS